VVAPRGDRPRLKDKRHYYTTHDMLNPKRIIPAGGPRHEDFMAPHGRA
jgi:glutathionyl-hydroquinone reductase